MIELTSYASPDSERAFLARCITDSDAAYRLIGEVTESCFTKTINRMVFNRIANLARKSEDVNMISVTDGMSNDDAAAVVELTEGECTATDAYLISQLDRYRRIREFAKVCLSAKEHIMEDQSIDRAISEILEIDAVRGTESYNPEQLTRRAVERWEKHQNDRRIIKFDIAKIDDCVRARHGNLAYVIAPPKTGKTWFLIALLVQLVHRGHHVEFVSCEMHPDDLYTRLVSYVVGIDAGMLDDPDCPRRYFEAYEKNMDKINRLKACVTNAIGMTHLQLQSYLRRIRKSDIVIIDYLQKIVNPAAKDLRISTVLTSGMLAEYTKKANRFVICASQAGRQAMQGKMTETWHGKESGSIEADADILLALSDTTNYDDWGPRDTVKEMTIKVSQRNGSSGRMVLSFNPVTGRYGDIPVEEGE